jgi:hypothetical protein
MVSDSCHKYRGISGDISRGLGGRFVFNSYNDIIDVITGHDQQINP